MDQPPKTAPPGPRNPPPSTGAPPARDSKPPARSAAPPSHRAPSHSPGAPSTARGAPPASQSAPPASRSAAPARSASFRLGAAASSALDRVRELARSLAESYRRSDKFFKMRAGIVASWALISVVTLWAACPASGPENSLGADVRVLRDSLVGGQQLLVRNESADNWTEVVFTLDDGWRRDQKTVRPHDQLVFSMSDFRRDGQPAPRDFKPKRLVVECEEGRATFDLR
ncbi:MAG TPA: hypothetical protein VFR85_02065 [Anaeromyxobacteraceae bacterium]|nr:hypothetical protein [Anaeromyxobacteraceae bacterium]